MILLINIVKMSLVNFIGEFSVNVKKLKVKIINYTLGISL